VAITGDWEIWLIRQGKLLRTNTDGAGWRIGEEYRVRLAARKGFKEAVVGRKRASSSSNSTPRVQALAIGVRRCPAAQEQQSNPLTSYKCRVPDIDSLLGDLAVGPWLDTTLGHEAPAPETRDWTWTLRDSSMSSRFPWKGPELKLPE
jgi:hypothetical protein